MINWSLTRVPRVHNGERIVSSVNGFWEAVYIHMQKNEVGPVYYSIHKNQLKMDWRL